MLLTEYKQLQQQHCNIIYKREVQMDSQTQIYIRGFPKSTTQNQLRQFFSEYASIEGVRIIRDYAFIDFKERDDADRAVKDKQGIQFQGRVLKVEIAGKPKKGKGPQPNDECRYCNKLGHWKKQCPKYLKERRRRSRSDSYDSRDRKHKKKSKSRRRKYSSDSDSSSSRSSSSSSSSSDSGSRSSSDRSRQKQKKKNNKKKDDK